MKTVSGKALRYFRTRVPQKGCSANGLLLLLSLPWLVGALLSVAFLFECDGRASAPVLGRSLRRSFVCSR